MIEPAAGRWLVTIDLGREELEELLVVGKPSLNSDWAVFLVRDGPTNLISAGFPSSRVISILPYKKNSVSEVENVL